MIINNNIPALNTYRQLGINQGAAQKAMEKLSSGLRINRAGDDAAGLAISEKMRAQVRGLNQASRNAQDGISLIQTAEGALTETHNILQRMRELAVQAANDTNVAVDRNELQKEVDQLSEELSRIANNTEFNTQKLLNGNFKGTFQIGANENQNMKVDIGDMRGFSLGLAGDATAKLTDDMLGDNIATDTNLADASDSILANKTLTVRHDGGDNYSLVDTDGNALAESTDGGLTYTTDTNVEETTIEFKEAVTSGKIAFGDDPAANIEATITVENQGLEAGTYKIDGNDLLDQNGKVIARREDDGIEFKDIISGETVLEFAEGNSYVDGLEITVKGLNIADQRAADTAITSINDAIEKVSAQRSQLGAFQNRLEHTIANLDNSAENLQAAESRIRDVDMAREIMEMTRANILGQASQAMLAQANMAPQSVLQLLG